MTAALRLLALLTAVGPAAGAGRHWARAESDLAAAVAGLDAAEPDWQIVQLHAARNKRLPPSERNAASLALEAVKLAPPSLAEFDPQGEFRTSAVSNRLCGESTIAEAERVRAECVAALAVARRLRDTSEGGFAVTPALPHPIGTLTPHVLKLREAANLLALDALVEARAGRPAPALDSCRAVLNVGAGGIGDEPLLISQLVRISCALTAVTATERALAWGADPPDAGLARLQTALASERVAPRLEYGYRGDRALVFAELAGLDVAGELAKQLPPGPASDALVRLAGHYLRREVAAGRLAALKLHAGLIAAAKLPDDVRRSRATAGALRRVPEPLPWELGAAVAYELRPSASRLDAAENRVRARLACAEVGMACERFRLKTGRFPAKLGDLPAELLAAVPSDPYTGGPLGYRVGADGVTVYSTGPDKIDDGGDIGFRLWNADRRRLPAPP